MRTSHVGQPEKQGRGAVPDWIVACSVAHASIKRCRFGLLDSNKRVVQSTDMRHARDRAGSLCTAPEWCVLTQGEVRSNGVVIGRVGTQRAAQMGVATENLIRAGVHLSIG